MLFGKSSRLRHSENTDMSFSGASGQRSSDGSRGWTSSGRGAAGTVETQTVTSCSQMASAAQLDVQIQTSTPNSENKTN